MLRLFGFLTLVLVAVCLAIGASIALAHASSTPAPEAKQERTVEAVNPDRRVIDDSLAAIEREPAALLEI